MKRVVERLSFSQEVKKNQYKIVSHFKDSSCTFNICLENYSVFSLQIMSQQTLSCKCKCVNTHTHTHSLEMIENLCLF